MALLAAAMILLSSQTTPDEQTTLLAQQVGIEPMALQGALNSTGASPAAYLAYEGLLDLPREAPVSARTEAATAVSPTARAVGTPSAPMWDRLAACESSGRWNANTGNGYAGGLQFDRGTWLAYGGGQYASSAHLASKAQQISVAERLRAARGMQPWPVCGRRV